MSAFSFECVKSHADSHVLHGVSPQDGTQSEGGVQDRCAEKLSDAVKPKDCGSVGIPFVIFDATKDTMR